MLSDTFGFLFVGTMKYTQISTGLSFSVLISFLSCVPLPPQTFRVTIVGPGCPRRLRKTLSRFPEVQVAGYVGDLAGAYLNADAVLVPIRAGGGTRIKVLEAFSRRRPVVSTSAGVEGIELADGKHALIADTPAGFADACLRLIREPCLGQELTQHAFELVGERHSDKALAAALIPLATRPATRHHQT